MGLLDLVTNTIEGTIEASVNSAKLVVAPVANIVDMEEDHFGDAAKGISNGVKKIGNADKQDD